MSPVTWHFCLLGLRTVSSKMSIPFGARATQLSLLVFPHSWSICQCLLQCLVSRWPQLLSWNTHTDRQLHHLVEVWQVKSGERYFSYLAKLDSLRILEYILGAQIFFLPSSVECVSALKLIFQIARCLNAPDHSGSSSSSLPQLIVPLCRVVMDHQNRLASPPMWEPSMNLLLEAPLSSRSGWTF